MSSFDQSLPPELYKLALEMEFNLAYKGKIASVVEIQSMPVGERNWHYERLGEEKAKEHKAQQEAANKQQQSTPAKKPRRLR